MLNRDAVGGALRLFCAQIRAPEANDDCHLMIAAQFD
jgi:hypothetical protein